MNDSIEKPVEWRGALAVLVKWIPSPKTGVRESAASAENPISEEAPGAYPGVDPGLALRRASGSRELSLSQLRMFVAENRGSIERLKVLARAQLPHAANIIERIRRL